MKDRAAHTRPHGLMAEFADAEPLVAAARAAHAAGYRKLDAYTPFHVEGLAEIIGTGPDRVPLLALLGGLVGGIGAYFLQWYSAVVDYPIVSGGRPLHSWPAFVVATFEMTVLGAALGAFFGMLLLNGLPRLIHPIFDTPHFAAASRDRFFLCIQAADARYEESAVRRFLGSLGPLRVVAVPDDAVLVAETR